MQAAVYAVIRQLKIELTWAEHRSAWKQKSEVPNLRVEQ
jgi:hypothetical protein